MGGRPKKDEREGRREGGEIERETERFGWGLSPMIEVGILTRTKLAASWLDASI